MARALTALAFALLLALASGCDDGGSQAEADDVSDGWSGWTHAARGNNHTVAVAANGTLWAWGGNNSGQLGQGGTGPGIATPQQVGTSHGWWRVAAGQDFSLALKLDGTLWGWGLNGSYQLGLGGGDNIDRYVPTRIGNGSSWTKIEASIAASHAMRSDGTLWSWGSNGNGELGVGDNTDRDAPTQVLGGPWKTVAAGGTFVMAIDTFDALSTWGSDSNGQLGQGGPGDQNLPQFVSGSYTWRWVSGGTLHAVGELLDGSFCYWGGNGAGQLGDGTTTPYNAPVCPTVPPIYYKAAAAGGAFTHVLTNDGILMGAGAGGNGELGIGDASNYSVFTPLTITLVEEWGGIVAGNGGQFGGAWLKNGTLRMWGVNSDGQLGNGNVTNQWFPNAVLLP